MKWTQKELEALYTKVNERALNDPEFREKVLKDVRAALEEVAGCEIPEDIGIQYIEKDNGYANTYVSPDFAQGEIDVDVLKSVGGGAGGYAQSGDMKKKQTNTNDVNVFLIVSVCGVAASVGPDAGLCGAAACPADACAAQACGAKACAGFACAADGCFGQGTLTEACGAQGCGAQSNLEEICGVATCGVDVAAGQQCPGVFACGAQGCGVDACTAEVCGAQGQLFDSCIAHGCGADVNGVALCVADARVIGGCGANIEVAGACGAAACGAEICGADACGAAIKGTGAEYVNVCGVDATAIDNPFGYDIPSGAVDICAAQFDGMVSDEAAVNDAE